MGIHDWNPEVGMEVFIVSVWGRRPPFNANISRIGKKYFYVKFGGWTEFKYHIDSKYEYSGEYSSSSRCYKSEADYKKECELIEMRREIEHNIQYLTDEQVEIVFNWIKDAKDA